MSVATSTAIAIGLGAASAATSIYSAKKQAGAAKDAAAQQQAGAKEARAYSEPLYQQALQIAQQQAAQGQAGLAPYAQQGAQGLTALSSFLGVPMAAGGGAAPGVPPVAAPAAAAPTFTPRPMPPGATVVGTAVPRGTVPAPGAATASSYVTLRAPTGEQQSVLAEQANYYLARGATRV